MPHDTLVVEESGADLRECGKEVADDVWRLQAVEADLRAAEDEAAADHRPEIEITTEEHAVCNDASKALAAMDAGVFQVHGVGLVHVLRDSGDEFARTGRGRPRGAPRIASLPKATLRERLTLCARWTRAGKPAHPPGWVVDALHARGSWPGVRRLEGIIEVPAVRDDATVIKEAGYDAATSLLHEPAGPFLPPREAPTREDAMRAVEGLGEIVIDFPFAGPEHRSAWLASLLTPIAAAGQLWPSPLFLFDANTRGSGKTLLADLVSLVTTGRPMPRMTLSESNEEARKALFSLALGGESLAFFDEAGVLRGPALNAALTGRVIKDRILGESRDATATMRATFYAAGNNVQVRGDTVRRVIHVRLDSKDEHPEERTGFKHPDVRRWVLEERPRLVREAVTVLHAYALSGRPPQAAPLGSFEGWSRSVRDPLIWAGAADPCKTRAALLEADSDAALLRQLLAGWREAAGDDAITVREAIDRLQRAPILRNAFEELGVHSTSEKPNTLAIGKRLAHYKERWCSGMRLVGKPDRNGVMAWRVKVAGDAGNAGVVF